MKKRIPLIARDLKWLYTVFLMVAVALFVVSSILTNFNVMTLVANADAFWTFIAEDFFPPALPKLSRIPGILDSVMVSLLCGSQYPRVNHRRYGWRRRCGTDAVFVY